VQRVCVFVCLSVCLSVFVCVANVRIVKSTTFVLLPCFQIILKFLVDSPTKKSCEARFFVWDCVKKPCEARFVFWDSVTVNTVAHTESEGCQKQGYRPRTCQSMVNTLQVDGLARIPRLTPALPKAHPQPQNGVPLCLV